MEGALSIGGPYFDDLRVGAMADPVPAVTLTEGLAAMHQAIVGDRLALSLDRTLAEAVLGSGPMLAHPQLVCDIAIGQSTVATQRVIANLFYRGLRLHRAVRLGDTLRTITEVVAVKRNRTRADTGLAALRVTTVDQDERLVLDFVRCAMLPLRESNARAAPDDDLSAISNDLPQAAVLAQTTAGWKLASLRERVDGPSLRQPTAGRSWRIEHGDTVTSAPELARMSLNLATAHLEPRREDARRLVYGGHTIGIACAHLTRLLPGIAYLLAWDTCDHTAPVYESDVLHTTVAVERVEALPDGRLVHLRCLVDAEGLERAPTRVLEWRPIALHV